ncbi:oligopeptide transporter [Cantharellus anzutake]|uniref:oligopeptide transporter n=1 Tax=Cantharellus anzutake TaxID=1750568 RepID=UPI00190659BF|nr:oligopeptide transporter [Cantharellus anzutake]KAF8321391.1 oligopeptide transporter [Cantharellus anzutake]
MVPYYPSYFDGELEEEEEDSPYPEVRASVSNIDDPEMPVLTVRMWILGLTLCVVAASANTFFNFRFPAQFIAPTVLLLIAHPCGKFLAYSMPINVYTLRLPLWLNRYEINLNPGPFNIKEHVLIYIMTNVSVFPAYAMNAVVVADLYYGIRRGFGFNILVVLGNQLAGFGIAGICRRFLVWPASLIWPQNLVACTLLNTLHAEDEEQSQGMTRYRFFLYVSIVAFFYVFLPGFLFQALSVFSWVCWFKPNNVPINQLFGVQSGLGMGILTFDWNQINFLGSPLMVPWWAEVHIMIGFVIMYWIIGPILYYTNFWHFAHLPMLGSQPYDRYGKRYNVTRVLFPGNHTLNQEAYSTYSHLYLPLNYAFTYLLSFALCTCVLVHTALYHGPALISGLKRAKVEDDDVHAKLMRYYPEVPDWWYALVFSFFFVMGLLAIALFHTGVPIWSLLVGVTLPLLYVLPAGFVYAYTGQSVSINVISEVLAGVLFNGKPFTNMMFKAYSVQTIVVAINFIQDLKLGHYIKVPPRATFTAQIVATMLTAVVQVATQAWLFSHVPDICSANQRDHLTCPQTSVYYSASVIWGVIGPTRQFGPGALYKPELYAVLFGALLPIPFWLWQRRYPKTILKTISMPVLVNGPVLIPPAVGIHFSSWFVVAFIFQYLVRRRNFRWWSKFNYILSSALDSGTLISLLFIFLTLQFPKGGRISVNWWGNKVFADTVDGRGGAALLLTGPEGFD